MERVVVVGASLAGLRAAEALRAEGFDGELTVVGAERHPPYTRPPLSKGVLVGAESAASCALQTTGDLRARWLLGRTAERLDLARREVALDGGERLAFDGLVVATGSRPRPWPGGPTPPGVLTLRTLDDALALRRALVSGPRRVLVVGAGFIGSEVASSCAALGVPVTLVELDDAPLGSLLGPQVGGFVAGLHRERGVDLRTGVTVRRFAGRHGLRAAELTDGTTVGADVAVLALGAVPDVGWLAGSGLVLDRGVLCRPDLRCQGADGVVAAGDVARWPHELFDGELVAVGHWTNAVEQGRHAARTLLSGPAGGAPFATVPTFWSDIHGVKLRSVGLPALADEAYVVEGSLEAGTFLAVYGRRGTIVGALSAGMHRRLRAYRELVEGREAVGTALRPDDRGRTGSGRTRPGAGHA